MASYDPKKVTAVIQSQSYPSFIITGWGEDTMVTGSKNEDSVTQHISAKGEPDYSDSANQSGTISFSIKHLSPANSVLVDLHDKKEEFSITVIDNNIDGDIGLFGKKCKVQTLPDWERAAEISEREWNVLCGIYKEQHVTNL